MTVGQRLSGDAVRAVLFDLDGTLIDSAYDLGAAADSMRLARGLPSLPPAQYRSMAGAGARGMLGVAFGVTPEHAEFIALREEFYGHYERCMADHTKAFEGVDDLLDALRARQLPWGVVTNKSTRFTAPLLAGMHVFHDAATVVCGDSTPYTKPHPAPLLEAMRRMDVDAAHCIYVGDDLRDIQAGRAAGMRTVAATYGYLGVTADTRQWGADARIESPLGLLQLLDPA